MMKRYSYLGIALIVTVFAFESFFLSPKSELMKETIETQYNAVRRDEQFIKSAGDTKAGIEEITGELKAFEKRMILENSEFLVSARLQGEVSGMSGNAGLKVLTMKTLSPVKQGSYSIFPLYFEGSGNIKQIADFLRIIEAGQFLIKVDKMNLNITNLQNPRELKFKMQVSGLSKL